MDLEHFRRHGLDADFADDNPGAVINGRSNSEIVDAMDVPGDAPYHPCAEAFPAEDTPRGAVHRIEGRHLLSDADEVYLRYVRRVEDVNLMPPDFREALACLLARELAVPVAQSNTLEDKLEARFRSRLRRARSTDGLEDGAEALPAGAWAEVR